MNGSSDSVNNGSDPPAVRILPPDDRQKMPRRSPGDDPSRRWLPVGVGVVAATLALLLVVTLPDRGVSTSTTTPAPLMSEFEATAVDLTTTPDPGHVDQWENVSLVDGLRSHIRDIEDLRGGLIAVGDEEGMPQAWVSSTGRTWRPAAVVEVPEAEQPVIAGMQTVFGWNGGRAAIGMLAGDAAVWFAEGPDSWEWRGTIPGFPTGVFPMAASAGEQLLVMAGGASGYRAFVLDGDWQWSAPIETVGLDNARLNDLTAIDGSYYAFGGGECEDTGCTPAVYRSSDGISWQQSRGPDGNPVSAEPGFVHDIAATGAGYMAIGHTLVDGGQQPAIWRSADGAIWVPLLTPEAFSSYTAQLAVTTIELSTPRLATLDVEETEHVVSEGSVIDTDAGVVLVTGVDETQVRLSVDGTPSILDVGSSGTMERRPALNGLAAQDQRIVVVGQYDSTSTLTTLASDPWSQSAAVWTSDDGGSTWERSFVSGDDSIATDVGLIGGNIAVAIAVVGASHNNVEIWHGRWNTDKAEEIAVAATHQFITTLNEGDATALAQLLPQGAPVAPRFELPSLGGVDLDWWQEGTQALDEQAMADTLDYMTALGTEITVEDCSTSVRLGDVDTVRVVCGFSVTSDLLRTLGVPRGLGRFEANHHAGMLTSFYSQTPPSLTAWQRLSEWAAGAEIGLETLGIVGAGGQWERPPVFAEETAAIHVDLASQFTATMLTPGSSRVAETPFGTMEWQWLETFPGDLSMVDSVTHTNLGFVAIGRESNELPSLSLWLSENGRDWVSMPSPEADWIWNLAPFRGGLIASGWRSDVPEIVIFDGEEWTSVPIPGASENQSVAYVVPNGESALVITTQWTNDNAPPEFDVMLLDADNSLARGVDPWFDEQNWPIGIAAMGDGYVVATTTGQPPSDLRVQYTEDGGSWTTLTNSALPEGARHVWRMDKHGDSLLVFGQLDEPRCTDTGSGASCQSAQGVWRSEDGVDWVSVVIEPDRPLFSELVGSGPLGLVALGQPDFEDRSPRPIYFSTTGEEWLLARNLTLFEPEATWSWENLPAISEDTIIIPRVSFYEGNPTSSQSEREKYSLIIGRLIEG